MPPWAPTDGTLVVPLRELGDRPALLRYPLQELIDWSPRIQAKFTFGHYLLKDLDVVEMFSVPTPQRSDPRASHSQLGVERGSPKLSWVPVQRPSHGADCLSSNWQQLRWSITWPCSGECQLLYNSTVQGSRHVIKFIELHTKKTGKIKVRFTHELMCCANGHVLILGYAYVRYYHLIGWVKGHWNSVLFLQLLLSQTVSR